ncbi:MAG: flagellin [Steroidobacteraceae bacterium]|nr:flagellin [Steroidobacteraceae bacterium]
MALSLNTNIDSLVAQNNLNGSQALLSQSLTRLSSGLRINSAADDAAGLAISQQFTTQINGTNQAINNANNAISEAQTAGGALSTIVNNLQSIRTLAVEAANGSNSASDRAALDQQVQQQIAEITRVATQTSFNGSAVLSGGAGVTNYQVGANVGDTIAVNLAQGVGANQVGAVASSMTALATAGGSLSGALTIAVGSNQAVTVGASSAFATSAQTAGSYKYQDASSAYAAGAAINAAGASGLTATVTNNQLLTFASGNQITTGIGAGTSYNLQLNGVTVYSATENSTAGVVETASSLVSAINNYSTQDGGITAQANGTNGIILTAADGSNINVNQSDTGAGLTTGIKQIQAWNPNSGTNGAVVTGSTAVTVTDNATVQTAGSSNTTTGYGQLTLSAGQNITLGGSTTDAAAIGQSLGTIATSGTLQGQNVLTVNGANNTIQAVDSALATVSQFQSQLGAIQNRFTSAVQNLATTAQNLTQSNSTIISANFAQETANLTKSQVLEQAGISVLAQANSEPQLILKLIP